MGKGTTVHCSKCEFEHTYYLGVSMGMFEMPDLIRCKNLKGRYSKEWIEFVNKNPDIYVRDEGKTICICPSCKKFKVVDCVSLCDKEDRKIEGAYLIENYPFKCSKCRTLMKKVDAYDADFSNLNCPKCGQPLVVTRGCLGD